MTFIEEIEIDLAFEGRVVKFILTTIFIKRTVCHVKWVL